MAECTLFEYSNYDEFFACIRGEVHNCGLCKFWDNDVGQCVIEATMLEAMSPKVD
jgi:hypothetical protein